MPSNESSVIVNLCKIMFNSVKMMQPKERTRHRSNRTRLQSAVPRVAQVLPQGREYGAFLASGHQSQSLADMNNVFSQFHNRINDFAREEVLLKPWKKKIWKLLYR